MQNPRFPRSWRKLLLLSALVALIAVLAMLAARTPRLEITFDEIRMEKGRKVAVFKLTNPSLTPVRFPYENIGGGRVHFYLRSRQSDYPSVEFPPKSLAYKGSLCWGETAELTVPFSLVNGARFVDGFHVGVNYKAELAPLDAILAAFGAKLPPNRNPRGIHTAWSAGIPLTP